MIVVTLVYTKYRDHNMIRYSMALICASLTFRCYLMNIREVKIGHDTESHDLFYATYEVCVTFQAAVFNIIIFLMIVDIKYKFLINIIMTTSIIVGIFYSLITHFEVSLVNLIFCVLQASGVIVYMLAAFYIILSIQKVNISQSIQLVYVIQQINFEKQL